MQMTLTDSRGRVIYLPRELALDDSEQALDVPGLVVPGRHGRRPYGHLKRLEPKVLRASGTIHEMSREAADHLAMSLRSMLLGQGPMKLRRSAEDDRWIEVVCTRVSHNYHRGRFWGQLASFNIQFEADDPFWYHEQLSEVVDDIDGFDTPMHLIEVQNEGDATVDPIIWITGRTKSGQHTVNPVLHNYATGRTIKFTGELQQDELVILDPARRTAVKIPTVEHSGTARGGGNDTILLALTASSDDAAYLNQIIRITAGTGAGQIRMITGYNGATKSAMVSQAWDVAPDATSQYEIYWRPDEFYALYEAQWGQFVGSTGGVNVLPFLNVDYIVNGFPLVPGMNPVEVSGDTAHLKVSFIYRARWY